MHDAPLTDAEITARIRAARRCPIPRCREQRPTDAQLCDEHRDELGRILNPDYVGERDLDRAASIPQLYARLDPTPATTGDHGPRAPGFASTPPCDLTPIVMRDNRSVPWPVVDAWYDPHPSGHGDDYDSPHYEDEAAPRAVEKTVAGVVAALWDDWGHHGPLTLADARTQGDLAEQCAWLHDHLDELIARLDADELYRDLADLHNQLRPAAGDPKPRPVAHCTGYIRDRFTGENVECGAPLFMPPPQPGVDEGLARPPKIDPSKPVIRCPRCDRPYTHLMLLRLEVGEQRRAC